MIIDMWYGNKPTEADRITAYFCDLDAVYRGNLYKEGRVIGDYTARHSYEIEQTFTQFRNIWGD